MSSSATTASITNDNDELPECPICLETLTISEHVVYPLPCQHCDYNYCNRCVERFCNAAEDDFQLASDGSKQVKVSVSCPQCRSKYPMDNLYDIVLLRQAHSLGTSILQKGEMLTDSDLTATQLSWKRDFVLECTRETLRDAQAVYTKYMKGKLDTVAVEKEARVWETLLEKLPVEEESDELETVFSHDGDQSQESKSSRRSSHSKPKKTKVDETLFQGLHDSINQDEKVFLTDLLTSGDVRSLAQAAMILQGILRLSLTGKSSAALSKRNEMVPMSKYDAQKQIDLIEKTKISFPLPNHMPGYFLIPSFSKKDKYMTLVDEQWDGRMTPPQRSIRIFDQIYEKYYSPPADEYPKFVVTIQGVWGPIGRLGLRKGDVVTHVNEVEWKGNAKDLQDYIHDCHIHHAQDEISLTVNATSATATFLKIRQQMLERSRLPTAK